jgi:hypothetical protein
MVTVRIKDPGPGSDAAGKNIAGVRDKSISCAFEPAASRHDSSTGSTI